MTIHLIKKTTKEGNLMLTLPMGTRLSVGAIGGLLVGFSAYFSLLEGKGPFDPLNLALLVLTVAATLYEERWIFERSTQTLIFRFGLLPLPRRHTIPFSAIEKVKVEYFVKGRSGFLSPEEARTFSQSRSKSQGASFFSPPLWINLVLLLTNGGRLVLDSRKGKAAFELSQTGKEIAFFLGKELEE
ncbi:MAG: hypothetical protein N2Z76_06595 [Treponemataceae bacterium]|nr:hypothetical protein [Treponemataceae bacterium]